MHRCKKILPNTRSYAPSQWDQNMRLRKWNTCTYNGTRIPRTRYSFPNLPSWWTIDFQSYRSRCILHTFLHLKYRGIRITVSPSIAAEDAISRHKRRNRPSTRQQQSEADPKVSLSNITKDPHKKLPHVSNNTTFILLMRHSCGMLAFYWTLQPQFWQHEMPPSSPNSNRQESQQDVACRLGQEFLIIVSDTR